MFLGMRVVTGIVMVFRIWLSLMVGLIRVCLMRVLLVMQALSLWRGRRVLGMGCRMFLGMRVVTGIVMVSRT